VQNPTVHPLISLAELTVRDAYIGALFPPGPGTFSSFAAHPSRLGYHALNQGIGLEAVCSWLIRGTPTPQVQTPRELGDIMTRVLQNGTEIDNQLARVLFVLDICDTADQIKNILTQVMRADQQRDAAINGAIANPTNPQGQRVLYNEYDHRPVSATSLVAASPKKEGDCVQTLYRHLINIAVQNNRDDARLKSYHEYNVGHLPDALKSGYYGRVHIPGWTAATQVRDTLIIPAISGTPPPIQVGPGEAGLTDLAKHQYWHNALTATVFASITGNLVAQTPAAFGVTMQPNVPGIFNKLPQGVAADAVIRVMAEEIAKGTDQGGISTALQGQPLNLQQKDANILAVYAITVRNRLGTAQAITGGSIANIATVLGAVAHGLQQGPNGQLSALGPRNQGAFANPLGLNFPQAVTADERDIEDALNRIDGRGTDSRGVNRFTVAVKRPPQGAMNFTTQDFTALGLPDLSFWAKALIEIVDNLWGRRIIIGVEEPATQGQPGGHAEILRIVN
jgi:hypothetical protein